MCACSIRRFSCDCVCICFNTTTCSPFLTSRYTGMLQNSHAKINTIQHRHKKRKIEKGLKGATHNHTTALQVCLPVRGKIFRVSLYIMRKRDLMPWFFYFSRVGPNLSALRWSWALIHPCPRPLVSAWHGLCLCLCSEPGWFLLFSTKNLPSTSTIPISLSTDDDGTQKKSQKIHPLVHPAGKCAQ